MRYVFVAGRETRMHIQRYSGDGCALWASLCGSDLPFNRSINAPFALGRKVCKHCEAVARGERRLPESLYAA